MPTFDLEIRIDKDSLQDFEHGKSKRISAYRIKSVQTYLHLYY